MPLKWVPTENLELETRFDRVDRVITTWMAHYGVLSLRIGLGIVFFWFGALKLFPDLSPAEQLVRDTVKIFVDPDLFLPVLAVWEMLIGLGLIFGKFIRATILLLFLQMPGTMLPLLLLPDEVWTEFPFGLTLEGQYIIKNVVLVTAALVIGATVRGGRLISEPDDINAQQVEKREREAGIRDEIGTRTS